MPFLNFVGDILFWNKQKILKSEDGSNYSWLYSYNQKLENLQLTLHALHLGLCFNQIFKNLPPILHILILNSNYSISSLDKLPDNLSQLITENRIDGLKLPVNYNFKLRISSHYNNFLVVKKLVEWFIYDDMINDGQYFII